MNLTVSAMNEIKELTDKLRDFANERDWNQFHSAKNLTMALAGEVGELSEIFQWKPENDELSAKELSNCEEELADILLYLIRLADRLDINLAKAANDKIAINAAKYPVKLSKGNSKKYTELNER